MKLFYFLIIAIGIMFTLGIAGIDTGSNRVIDMLWGDGISTNVNPSVSGTSATELTNATDFWGMTKLFFLIAIGLSLAGAFLGGQRSEAAINAVASGAATFIFTMFVLDIFSVLKLMYSITGGVGWIFNITWIIIIPFLFAFGYSLFQFIMGTE